MRGDFIKYTLDKFLSILYRMDESGEFELAEDEYIRLVGIKADGTFTHYHKTVEAVKADITKYRQVYNLFLGIATSRGESGKVENMRTRKAVMLDFDKKDFPEFKTAQDFTAHIKAIIPELYIHAIVDTGHGYHCYIAVTRTADNERVTAVNKALAEILRADTKATLPTQLVRIPTTYNLKKLDDRKCVNIVTNALERSPQTFKAYKLEQLERFVQRLQQNEANQADSTPLPKGSYNKISSYHCIGAMLAEGAKQGERNFCLGRITKYLQTIKGETKQKALETVLEWNRRCDPPKAAEIVKADFERYWTGDYKLLGCNLEDENHQRILNRYCDKHDCMTIFEKTEDSDVESVEMFFDNNILRNRVIKTLTGYHLLILSVMNFVGKPLKRKELVKWLTGRRTKKCCMSDKSLSKYLPDLVEKKYVIYDDFHDTYEVNTKSYKPTYTRYSYGASLQFINKLISPCEYMVYLCLVRNLQQNKNVTYETLASDLGKDEGNIPKYIKGLHEAGLINVNKSYNDKGVLYNTYKLFY